MRSHTDLDRRSLALHQAVAARLRQQPEHWPQVRATLRRWREQVDPRSQPYLLRWEQALDDGPEAALALATEDSQSAAALRQCSPFTGILSHAERFAFLKSWRP
jgi:hypothetical protein